MNDRLPELLAERLTKPLHGPMVGSRFEPRPRYGRRYDQPSKEARRAAVLALLYPHGRRWHLPLTVRQAGLPDHAGQVSLPGGAIDPGETSWEAALREFHEELGAAEESIQPLGRLSPLYVDASNFLIDPWLGAACQRPEFVPNMAEVRQVLEIPLAHLLDPGNFGTHRRRRQAQPYVAPYFRWQSYRIWGATCMILGELVTLINQMRADV